MISHSRSAALDIIERWIAAAETRHMGIAMAELWTVRDILEGVIRVPDARREKALEFVKACKASPERDAIIEAMEVEK